MYACVYAHPHVCVCVCVCVCMCIRTYVCMHVCTGVLYTHMYNIMCIHACVFACVRSDFIPCAVTVLTQESDGISLTGCEGQLQASANKNHRPASQPS